MPPSRAQTSCDDYSLDPTIMNLASEDHDYDYSIKRFAETAKRAYAPESIVQQQDIGFLHDHETTIRVFTIRPDSRDDVYTTNSAKHEDNQADDEFVDDYDDVGYQYPSQITMSEEKVGAIYQSTYSLPRRESQKENYDDECF